MSAIGATCGVAICFSQISGALAVMRGTLFGNLVADAYDGFSINLFCVGMKCLIFFCLTHTPPVCKRRARRCAAHAQRLTGYLFEGMFQNYTADFARNRSKKRVQPAAPLLPISTERSPSFEDVPACQQPPPDQEDSQTAWIL